MSEIKIIKEGVNNFPENKQIIAQRKSASADSLLTEFSERYHGMDRPGCLLVKCRKELVAGDHTIDMYVCLTHNKEALFDGWELHWWGGEYNLDLED